MKLVSFGANPNSQIQKLERFRDLEAERKRLCEANQLVYVPQEKVAQEGEKGLKREEILKQRKKNEKLKKKENHPSEKRAKTELEYHETMGLQNAFHLACSCPHPVLINQLKSLGTFPDAADHKGMTPFNIIS